MRLASAIYNASTFFIGINGEDYDCIDYATGLHGGLVYMSNPFNHSNRMSEISVEIGPRSTYVASTALKGERFKLK